MKHLIAIVLMTAFFNSTDSAVISWQPAGIPLVARWDGPGRATIIWSGPGCLYRVPENQAAILIACYPRDAAYILELGHAGPLDAAYRSAIGDVYVLWRPDGTQERAALLHMTYLALTMKQTAQRAPPVYLAWVGR